MKVYALALWILSSLDADTIAKVRTGIETNGVYSAFHGNWWIRLTKSRGDIYGQMDEVGTGARTKLMENQLNIAHIATHDIARRHAPWRNDMLLARIFETINLIEAGATQNTKNPFRRHSDYPIMTVSGHLTRIAVRRPVGQSRRDQ